MENLPDRTVTARADGDVWPGAAYQKQIKRLKQVVGETVFLAEIRSSEVNLSVTMENRGFELLGVIDFPRPDPEKNLYPHLIVLDDGRGINMGQIARISFNRPFQPAADDILYQDGQLLETLMYCERSLTRGKVEAISRQELGAILGRPEAGTLLSSNQMSALESDQSPPD